MLNNILLGVKDFWFSFWENIIYILFLSGTIFILNISLMAMIVDIDYNDFQREITDFTKTNVKSHVISYNVGYEDDTNIELLNSLSMSYKDGDYTYITDSIEKDNKLYLIYYIFGAPKEFPLFDSENISVFSINYNDNDNFSLSVDDQDIKIQQVLEDDFKSPFTDPYNTITSGEDYILYMVIENPNLIEWIDPNIPESVHELVDNSYISIEHFDDFKEIFIDTFLEVVPIHYSLGMQETKYIMTFIIPLIIILIAVFFISIYNIIKGLIIKKSEEFTIHLLCGATLSQISIRIFTSFFINILIVIAVHITFFNFSKLFIYSAVIQCLIISIVFLIIIIKKLSYSNLISNLRGE